MKKTIAILLASIMLVSMAGCSKKETKRNKNEETTVTATENSGESKSGENVIVARLNLDPKNAEAGKFELVGPLEAGDVSFINLNKIVTIDGEEWPHMVAGSKVELDVEYTAKETKTITVYILPYSTSYRWDKSEALQSFDVILEKTTDENGIAQISFNLPESMPGANYSFLFMDGDDAVAYFFDYVLKDKNETLID